MPRGIHKLTSTGHEGSEDLPPGLQAHFSKQRILVVHDHGNLPAGPPVKLTKDHILITYTEPGQKIYSSESKHLLEQMDYHKNVAAKPPQARNDVRLRFNSDATPNYTINFKCHNGYAVETTYPLGYYVYDPSADGDKLEWLENQGSSETDVQHALSLALKLSINITLLFGCKGGTVLGVEEELQVPSFGDEVEVLAGISLIIDGKEYYTQYDRGRVSRATYVTESDAIKRFEVTWYRSGLMSSMKEEKWMSNFRRTGHEMKLASLGNEVEVLPGISLNAEGTDYYATGDRGRVSRATSVTESDGIKRLKSDGIKRLEVTWYRTGLTSTMIEDRWIQNFRWIEEGIKVPNVSDMVEVLPGKALNLDGKEYYKTGDRGRVSRATYVTESDGIKRFEVTWYRTGRTSTMKEDMWMRNFRRLEEVITVPVVGDEVEVLHGISFNLNSTEYYAPEDRGRVSRNSYVTEKDGIKRFEVTWDRTKMTSTMMEHKWMKNFRKVQATAHVPHLGDEVDALPGKCLNLDGKEYYAPGDRGRISQATYVTESDGIRRFKVNWHRTGLTSTMKEEMWMANLRWIKMVGFADEMEVLPGIGLSVDGKEYYKTGDRGRVSRATCVTESDGIKRFEVTWYRTGLTSTMKEEKWMENFRWMKEGIKAPHIGDEVDALPGVSLTIEGKEYYAPGDRGRVSRDTYVTPKDRIKRFEIDWNRTGLTSTMIEDRWLNNFYLVKG